MKFKKQQDTKINIQKLLATLYINNELSKRETKKIIPFTVASQISWASINQGGRRLYLENYKTIKKEIEADTN